MNANQLEMLPTVAGVTELMRELSPHGLALNLECLQRLAQIMARPLLPRAWN